MQEMRSVLLRSPQEQRASRVCLQLGNAHALNSLEAGAEVLEMAGRWQAAMKTCPCQPMMETTRLPSAVCGDCMTYFRSHRPTRVCAMRGNLTTCDSRGRADLDLSPSTETTRTALPPTAIEWPQGLDACPVGTMAWQLGKVVELWNNLSRDMPELRSQQP